jgi:hypothetical protein
VTLQLAWRWALFHALTDAVSLVGAGSNRARSDAVVRLVTVAALRVTTPCSLAALVLLSASKALSLSLSLSLSLCLCLCLSPPAPPLPLALLPRFPSLSRSLLISAG